MSRLFVFIGLVLPMGFYLSSCTGRAGSYSAGARTCPPGAGPSRETLERKKDILFREILISDQISHNERYLQGARKQIRDIEKTGCLKRVEKVIDSLSDGLKNGFTVRRRRP